MRYIRDDLNKVAVDNVQELDGIDMADLRASDSLAVKAEMIFSQFFQRGVSRWGDFLGIYPAFSGGMESS